MSSNHHAVFANISGPKEISAEKYISALISNGFLFAGSVRGFQFEEDWGDFEPILDQEVENLADWQEAIEHSKNWPCISIDARMRLWPSRYIFLTQIVIKASHGFALYFPDAWYKTTLLDQSVYRAWETLGTAILSVAGHAGFICGSSVALRPMTEEDILKALSQIVEIAAGSSKLHSHSRNF